MILQYPFSFFFFIIFFTTVGFLAPRFNVSGSFSLFKNRSIFLSNSISRSPFLFWREKSSISIQLTMGSSISLGISSHVDSASNSDKKESWVFCQTVEFPLLTSNRSLLIRVSPVNVSR